MLNIIGVDEAGRGPLVGNVVAALENITLGNYSEINDSKIFKDREQNYFQLSKKILWVMV